MAALASFLQARAHGGAWRLRIDDLDTPRVKPGAARQILRTLELFGLCWDGPVLYQSTRSAAYADALRRLRSRGCLFDCGCSRRETRTGPPGLEGPIYPGTCRHGMPVGRQARSVRIRAPDAVMTVADRVQGRYRQNLARDIGDFVLRRADGFVAYQLATVVDDAAQGVREVVRGADLLSSTPRQLLLHQALAQPVPAYAHVPVLMNPAGRKLSKSHGAMALDLSQRERQLVQMLELLGQQPEVGLEEASLDRIMAWAIAHLDIAAVPARRTMAMPSSPA